MSRDEQVRSEIQTYLQALDSYPECFLRDPKISFEEHRRSIGRAEDSEKLGDNNHRRRA